MHWLASIALLLPTLTLAQPSATGTTEPARTLKGDWEALLASGCDLGAAHIHTPVEASALRNTPYALKGYTFKTPELTKLFEADGGWYKADPSVKEPTFSPAEQACIQKIKDLESKLPEVSKALKNAFFSQRTEYLSLRAHTQPMGAGPVKVTKLGGGGLELVCEPCKESSVLQISEENGEPRLLVPGI